MTRRGAFGAERISVELIVPEYVEVLALVHLAERSAQRVDGRVAETAAALSQRLIGAAREAKLLAEVRIGLNRTPERACSLRASAVRTRLGIELEHKPPIYGLTRLQQESRSTGWVGSWRGNAAKQHENPQQEEEVPRLL